jgi:hypothetical protein
MRNQCDAARIASPLDRVAVEIAESYFDCVMSPVRGGSSAAGEVNLPTVDPWEWHRSDVCQTR